MNPFIRPRSSSRGLAASLLCLISLWSTAALATDQAYSPYAGGQYPSRVLWGDTHLHTTMSFDARSFGVTLGAEEAYRFARGEEVVSSTGQKVRLRTPLDFLVVTDHSDAMGSVDELIRGNEILLADPELRETAVTGNAMCSASLQDDKHPYKMRCAFARS